MLIVAGSLFVLALVGVGIYMGLRWRTISNKSAPKAPKDMYAVDGKERDEGSPKARLPGRRQDTEQAPPSDWSRMYTEAQGPPALRDAVEVFSATQGAWIPATLQSISDGMATVLYRRDGKKLRKQVDLTDESALRKVRVRLHHPIGPSAAHDQQ